MYLANGKCMHINVSFQKLQKFKMSSWRRRMQSHPGQMWYYLPIIPPVGNLRQEEHTVQVYPGPCWDPASKGRNLKIKKKKGREEGKETVEWKWEVIGKSECSKEDTSVGSFYRRKERVSWGAESGRGHRQVGLADRDESLESLWKSCGGGWRGCCRRKTFVAAERVERRHL